LIIDGKMVFTIVPSMITSDMAMDMKTSPTQRLRTFVN
jgi:hypothetical protein